MFKLITFITLLIMSFASFASDGATDLAAPPAWIMEVLQFLAALPFEIGGVKVGVMIVTALNWVATIGAVATALSVAVSGIMLTLSGVLKVPQLIAVWSGADELAAKLENLSVKIQELNVKIQPWLKYISIFNVQKPK